MRYIRPIDPHVHLRGSEAPQFFVHSMNDARAVGLAAVCEMPNTTPALTTHEAVNDRIQLSNSLSFDCTEGIRHRINIGVTSNFEQVANAIQLATNNPTVTALKIFFTHSTGDMGILDEQLQYLIWEQLSKYTGVVMGHFEDEKHFVGEFKHRIPLSHSFHQPPYSEISQVMRQIANAQAVGFKGVFWVCHISNPKTIDFLRKEEANCDFKIIIEMTWHHMFLNTLDYRIHGHCVKMNPPLRDPEMQTLLLANVLGGHIDVIGTDHAPHPLELKYSDTPASGIPAIPFWPKGIEKLKYLGMTDDDITNITFDTPNEVLKLGLVAEEVEVEYDRRLWDKYGWNPFSRVD